MIFFPRGYQQVEAGAVLLLRFALDDSSHLVYSEAVRGLYYLIASEPDELCLSMAQPWVPAGVEPGISSDIHACEKVFGYIVLCIADCRVISYLFKLLSSD